MATYTVESASSPQWANAERTLIDLSVKFVEFDAPMPFAASPNDTEPYGPDLFQRAVNGEYGPIGDYPGGTP